MARIASGMFVSIVTERDGCDSEAMRLAYNELCAEAGHEVKHPGILESDVADFVKPIKRTVLAENSSRVLVSDAIARFRERTFSDLWNVPEVIHCKAVSSLEERYRGTEHLVRKERVVMFVWAMKDIERFAAGDGQQNPE